MVKQNNDKIKILDDRAQSRDKLPIWFGSRDNFTHGVKEVIANAADELRNNGGETRLITVKLHDDFKTLTITDNGRGIKIHGEENGFKRYELLFMKLFAGTKYDVTESVTTGTNGVGNTVLNYTSSYFKADSYYDGKVYTVEFEDGGRFKAFSEDNSDKEHGTHITFRLDDKMYTKVEFTSELIDDIVNHFAVAALNIKFIFIDDTKEPSISKEYLYGNYEDRFKEMVDNKSTSAIYTLGDMKFEEEIKLITEDGEINTLEKNSYNIMLTTMPEAKQESYLNMTYLERGGTINEGILDGVRLFLNKYCRDNKKFPKGMTYFKKDDIEFSVGFLAVVESNNVEYANQTKLATNKETYGKQAKKYVDELLTKISIEQPATFKKLLNHVLMVAKHNSANDSAVKKLTKKLKTKVDTIQGKIKKLIDCEIHGLEAELYVTEGDSANGSIIDARDDEFQAAYPLRGKMINTLKADYAEVFKNEEANDLIRAIGAGVYGSKKKELEFDLSKARYGKIIIATDADPDGYQIAVLITVFVYKYLRPMLENGMLYIAKTPLYELKLPNDEVVYFNSEKEKDDNIGKYEGKKYTLNRLKGLGEVDAHIMHETAMNPETRNLVQIKVEKAEEAYKMLNDWMDNPVEPRKDMINVQLPSYIDLTE